MADRDFHLILIKPSHYDDDGYVIQFWRAAMPANTLATIQGLAEDCDARRVLGADVRIRVHAFDETNTRINVDRLARLAQQGAAGLVGLVGVQSNQFPRALDLARAFRERGIDVCIGGFHVSGVLAMLDKPTPEILEAQALGISLFAGEAESHFDQVLADAYNKRLQPVYNYMADLPDISHVPTPILSAKTIGRTVGKQSSFDAGRGCPFECSFCTIINVQGRKSRYRSSDDVEQIVRRNLAQGVRRFFITDDNFARNKNWELIVDRLIEIRQRDNLQFNLVIQVDTLCHKIPGFVEKCVAAGVKRVFIGLENINPDSLKGAKKRQNRITEYRAMVLAWKHLGVFTIAGYILGFPTDTKATILRDVQILMRELPLDLVEFFYLTPLPGSADHKTLTQQGVAMAEDLNKYDLNHVTTGHPLMSEEEWQQAYYAAWDLYYSEAHITTLMRRARATGVNLGKINGGAVSFYCSIALERVHPLESGIFRLKYRRDRRPGLPLESAATFYPRYLRELVSKTYKTLAMLYKFNRVRKRLESDPATLDYMDAALAPVTDQDVQVLELFSVTDAAAEATEKEVGRKKAAEARGRRREAVALGQD